MDRKTASDSRGQIIKVATGIAVRQWQNSTTIRISFRFKGVECRETLSVPATKPNLQYAERLRGEIINAIARNTFNYGKYFPKSKRARIFGHVNANPLIGDLLTKFLEETRKVQQPITYATYCKICRSYLMKTFSDIPVKQLTPAFIREWVISLDLTAKTIRNILIPLRTVLEQAVNNDILKHNPLDRVVLNKLLDKKAKSGYAPDPFNLTEIHAILACAQGQIKNLFQFAFFTGLRPSELIALEWQDIDWNKGVAHISRAVVEKQEKCTKTNAGTRTLLLLPPALEALQAQKAYTFLQGKRVFHNPYLNKPWQDHAKMRRVYWTQALKKAGVRYRNLYQTRHTYASMLLSSGENMLWMAKQMGHRDTEMIVKIYGKWIPDNNNHTGYQTKRDWGQVLPASSTFATA